MSEIRQSEETTVKVNEDIEIAYDTFGESLQPPLLLVMGLGSQMIMWDEEFCKQIAAKGYWVIRFDNRDVGLSTKLNTLPVPDPMQLFQALQQGKTIDVPYSLLDMAKDAVGLLNALKVKSAHIVGASMGGMIAQTIAIHFPERVRTLTSIMSTTGNPDLPLPQPEAQSILIRRPPENREEYIEYSVQIWRILNGPIMAFDEEFYRQRSARIYDRNFYPAGTGRQLGAIMAAESRKKALKEVKIPTLVIHGDVDPLVPVEGGKDTAKAIPDAKLMIIEGMGHNIPVTIAPQIIEAIASHTV
ncbi:MAG: alpha/beta fold hydrolase [Candidatus Hodarchaeota archaeon]